MIIFKNFWVLFLSPLVIVFIFLFRRRSQLPSFRFSSSQLVKELRPTLRVRLRGILKYLRAISMLLVIFALARPQSPAKGAVLDVKGIDIILAIDCSTSMLAEDFVIENERVNRLDVTKMVVKDFVSKRSGDRLGVVTFGSHAYTACPLVIDYDWVKETMSRTYVGISEDSTSIGYAVATSVNRLQDSDAKSKIVILLTDGRNNAGDVVPQTAAEIARTMGIKIYTVGVGTKGSVPYPFTDALGVKRYKNIKIDLDEETLREISRKTNGKYFRATDTESLKRVYSEINKLEKTELKGKKFSEYEEIFSKFLIAGLILLFIEILLDNTILRRIP